MSVKRICRLPHVLKGDLTIFHNYSKWQKLSKFRKESIDIFFANSIKDSSSSVSTIIMYKNFKYMTKI